MNTIIVTGTDTDVGKTIFAAALVQALGASYWKPVQAGLAVPTDSQIVAALAAEREDQILPEAYCLNEPIAPHIAAAHAGMAIDPDQLHLPCVAGALVVEGAGGVLVPITADFLFADLFARWAAPVVLVARTALGTINHSLLSIEALRARRVPILGIAFVGPPNVESELSISKIGNIKRLGRLPIVEGLDGPWLRPQIKAKSQVLAQAFAANFRLEDFQP
jgi:dethiobiotin synthetase